MYKQAPSSNYSNYSFTNPNQYENINTPLKDFSDKISNMLKNNDICQKHKEPFIKYCTNCSTDICKFCSSYHENHLLINYEDISPDNDEINILQNTLKRINEDYSKLLEEIIKWKNNLEEKIFYFERLIEKNEILNDVDFIYSFNNFKKNFSIIMKFRQIFSSVISPEKSNKNNNIMKIARTDKKYNLGYYNYYQYNISKALLELLINSNQDDNNFENDNNFIYKGNLIIKYLWDSFKKTNIENKKISSRNNKNFEININPKKNRNSKSYYNTGTYCGSLRLENEDENSFNENNKNRNLSNKQSKIIEKHIDLKMGNKKKLKQDIKLTSPYLINMTTKNNCNNIFMKNDKINTNYVDNNYKNSSKVSNRCNNRTLSTSYSSQNLFSNNFNNNDNINTKQNNKNKIYEKLISYTPIILNKEQNNQRVYSKKKCINLNDSFNNKLNQTNYNIRNPLGLDTDEENNNFFNNNLGKSNLNNNIISINIDKKERLMGRSNSLKYISKNNFNPDKISYNNISNTSNLGKENEIVTSKYIPEIRTKTLIYNKNGINNKRINTEKNINKLNINTLNINKNQGKTFKHKKLNINENASKNAINDSEKLNQTQLYNKPIDNFQEEQLNNSNILNNTFTQSPFNSNIQKNIIISKKESQPDTNIQFSKNNDNNNIKSSIFQNNQQNSKNKNISSIHTIKNNPDTKFLINPNVPLCIGLDLDNSECKISFVNQVNGDIELFCFEKNQYSIPTVISFNDNNEIIIGNEAELLSITNPTQTIFNLLKMVGKNYNEIIGMKEIWPFKIYCDNETKRPYLKINFIKKEKKFFIEDMLNLFLKQLFDTFFKHILIHKEKEENNKNIYKEQIINIVLVVTVSNSLNYFQRKVIEKIFQRQIFPEIDLNKDNLENINKLQNINESNNTNKILKNSLNHKRRLYNGYQINLKKIKIENSSSIATLCLKGSKKNDLKDNNSLILNVGGGSINLSITSINTNKQNKIYEVKALNSAEFGEEDFTDNFVYDCLKEFDEKIYKECLATPGALSKLRRSCSIAKKYFDKNSQIEIKVSKLYGTIDLKMILIKNDYEKACNDLYKKIYSLIKEILKKAKLSEINIDNILLIGSTSRSDKVKNILKDLFKHNRLLYNKLSFSVQSDSDNDFYIVIGAAIQASNLLVDEPKYILEDIIPMSFGVETIDGLMEFVVEKGTSMPVKKEKLVKIKNDRENSLEIKIYEGEDPNVNKNRLISSAKIDKRNFKLEKIGKDFIEILIQFEIDSNLNLCVYVLDIKTFKRRFECLINIDVVKS